MNISSKRLQLATILYADIFDWPLTSRELIRWCIGVKPKKVLTTKGITVSRLKREYWAQEKWKKANKISRVLSIIPTLILVGVTGGLSRNNVRKNDDIDFFCITEKGTLWVSRLLAILVTELLKVRRRPGDKNVANKICLNMFMSEDSLSIQEKDLFSAYEVLQMVPLWKRDGAYRKFLSANRWVKRFLPNAWKERNYELRIMNYDKNRIFPLFIIRFFEPLARALQLWYMRNRRTTEVIAHGVLRFHPHDARVWVKRAFGRRLSKYNLPLDKIFYGR